MSDRYPVYERDTQEWLGWIRRDGIINRRREIVFASAPRLLVEYEQPVADSVTFTNVTMDWLFDGFGMPVALMVDKDQPLDGIRSFWRKDVDDPARRAPDRKDTRDELREKE